MACCKGPNATTCDCAGSARCSCKARPAGKCDCSHAAAENAHYTETCNCGKRPANGCTCSPSAGLREGEVDFTNYH